MQERGDDSQVARHWRLSGQQRQDPLVYLEVAPVDPVVVGHHHPGQLHVLVRDRLERPVELLDHDVQAVERLGLERAQVLAELVPCFLQAGNGIRRSGARVFVIR